jgi:transposase InsO family protein
MDSEDRERIALWKLSVLGPLTSARLEHGDRQFLILEAASRLHQLPDGKLVRLKPSTIADWYYTYKREGFKGLLPRPRSDRGRSRVINGEVADLILRVKQEKPRRSIRRIIKMLERAQVVQKGTLTRSSVHRLLSAAQLSARPVRGPATERRSFIFSFAGELCVGDSLHGPPAIEDGSVRKAYLLSQIDCATRFITHSYFVTTEGAVAQEYGLRQSISKFGLPRAYYVDLGAAYIAHSLKLICAQLDIRLLHTGVRDCEAKGVIERWHRTWREEVGDELPSEPLPIGELNAKHWAWLSAEYHARKHDTTGRAPREHWLEQLEHLRPIPRHLNLDEIFLHRERRFVRKDGTVRFRGKLLEVRPELVGRNVELRFDPSAEEIKPRVFVDDKFFCDTVPLDRLANATRKRRRIQGDPAPTVKPTGLDPLALIEDEHYRRTRPIDAAKDPETEEE